MSRAGFKKVLAVGVAIFALGLCAMPASAGGGCHHGCCGGGYGGCGYGCGCGGWYGGCGYGCGYWGCGYGWGSYGCGYGGCGYGWGSSYCGSCCATSVVYSDCVCSSCGGGQYITEPAGMPPTPPSTPPTASPSNGTPNRTAIESLDGGSASLTISVPAEAKVTINGRLTKSTGSERHFISYGLRAGNTYNYTVKVEIVRDGKVIPEEQTVSLTVGGQRSIAFGFNTPGSERLAATNPR